LFVPEHHAGMIRLIVNADDLGSSQSRDRGIFKAFAEGIVTSASLLANGPSFASAAAEARTCNLPVGVHLNLSEGKALSGPVGGLTDASGNFPGKTGLRQLPGSSLPDGKGIRRELLAQIERVGAAGLVPDHLDTHQHCLLIPHLTEAIIEAAIASGITALRLPLPAEPVSGEVPEGLTSELDYYRACAPAVCRALRKHRLWSPDGLWGMPLLNRLDITTLTATLKQIPVGTWELMVHPGYADAGDPFGGPEREVELTALTTPSILDLIKTRDIRLTSFGACRCAC